jgi:hypothetical protein
MAQFNITELDFQKIKQSTIDYFKSNEKYTDWNFEGSGLSVLMDVLAYNTHYNAMLAHLSLNETFLDSAQLRGNVASHAKLLGYLPRSAIASTAIVNISLDATNSNKLGLERGTRFTTVVDTKKYTFVNTELITVDPINNVYHFNNVVLKQGTLKRMLYRVDSKVPNQKFIIPDTNVDTTTVRVRLKSNQVTEDYTTYTRFTSLVDVDQYSLIYFIQENSVGNYELYFGDGILGAKPIDNQIVEIEYVYTDGASANGARAFTAIDSIGGQSGSAITIDKTSELTITLDPGNPIGGSAVTFIPGDTVTGSIKGSTAKVVSFTNGILIVKDIVKNWALPGVNSAQTGFTIGENITGDKSDATRTVRSIVAKTILSYGGAARESIESIRYNAPLTFITQNRAVTADDYRAIVQREFGNIQAITVWGGEHESNPNFGKVYISIKPVGDQNLLTTLQKEEIITLLRGKNVVSITPVIVDPEYTYVALDVSFKFNPNLTDVTSSELITKVRNAIVNYNENYLERFDGVFRSSQLLKSIDASNAAVLNSSIRVFMFKDITPSNTVRNNFDLQFTSPIYSTKSTESVITSNEFLINGVNHYFGDSPIKNSPDRQVYIYKIVNNLPVVVIADAGYVYQAAGRIVLNNFLPDTTNNIRITVIPNSNDLAPKRNQLIQIDPLEVRISGEIDTIAVSGSAGAINYTTPSRHR